MDSIIYLLKMLLDLFNCINVLPVHKNADHMHARAHGAQEGVCSLELDLQVMRTRPGSPLRTTSALNY